MFVVKNTTLYSILSECMHVCMCVCVGVCVIYDFLYLYVYVSACVLHTCLSVSLKCLTVLSCPQSVKSRKVETSKKSEGTVGMKER